MKHNAVALGKLRHGARWWRAGGSPGSQACHSCRRRMRSPRWEVGTGALAAWQHRTDPRSSEAVRGGESSSVANNLISVSCLTMEKSHVVRGSKNRLGKLLTTFADVKGKARAALGEKTSPARASPALTPGAAGPGAATGEPDRRAATPGWAAGPSRRLAAPLSSASPLSVPGRTLGAGARSGRLCLTALPPDPDL